MVTHWFIISNHAGMCKGKIRSVRFSREEGEKVPAVRIEKIVRFDGTAPGGTERGEGRPWRGRAKRICHEARCAHPRGMSASHSVPAETENNLKKRAGRTLPKKVPRGGRVDLVITCT